MNSDIFDQTVTAEKILGAHNETELICTQRVMWQNHNFLCTLLHLVLISEKYVQNTATFSDSTFN